MTKANRHRSFHHLLFVILVSTFLIVSPLLNYPFIHTIQATPPASISYDLWGVMGTDWGWSPYGSYVDDFHVNLLADYNCTLLIMVITIEAWDTNDNSNALSTPENPIPFQNYTEQIVDWCHQAEPYIHVVILMTSKASTYTAAVRYNIIRNVDGQGQTWIDRCKAIVQRLEPDGMLTMDEAFTNSAKNSLGVTQQEWRDWSTWCIDELRSVKSDLQYWTQGLPCTGFWDSGGFQDNPLENSGYENIIYYCNSGHYRGSDYTLPDRPWQVMYDAATTQEDLDAAQTNYYNYIAGRFGELLDTYQCYWQVSVAWQQGEETIENWNYYLNDSFQYCINHNIYCAYYGFSKGGWRMLTSDYDAWNEYGQFFADNVPAYEAPPEPPPPSEDYLFFDGFESNDFSEWNGTGGVNASVVGTQHHHGSYSASFEAGGETSQAGYCYHLLNDSYLDIYVRFYFKYVTLPQRPGYNAYLCEIKASNGTVLARLRYAWQSATGYYQFNLRNDEGGTEEYSGYTGDWMENDTWHFLELRRKADTSNGYLQLWFDQSLIISYNGNTGASANERVDLGLTYSWIAQTLFMDCCAIHDEAIGSEEQDASAPTLVSMVGNPRHNSTLADSNCMVSAKYQDNYELSGGIVGTNNTGVPTNQSWTSLSSNPDWLNYTMTLNATEGKRVEYWFYVNDTSDNWAYSGICYLVTTGGGGDSTPPMFSAITYNSSTAGSVCQFTIQYEDDVALSYSIHSNNNTGTWQNQTFALSENPDWHNVTITVNTTIGLRVEWKYYVNDTSNNWGETSIQFFVTDEGLDIIAPDFYATYNTTIAGNVVNLTCLVDDSYGLSQWIFGWNTGGGWSNDSIQVFSDTNIAQVNKTIPKIVGLTIQYCFYANDTSDNWGNTGTLTLTTTYEVGSIPSDILFYLSTYDTYVHFSDTTTIDSFSLTDDYWIFDGYGYQVQNGNMTINIMLTDYQVNFTVTGTTDETSISNLYVQSLGMPTDVIGGTSWSYDNSILTINVLHASSQTVIIRWDIIATQIRSAASVVAQLLSLIMLFQVFGVLFTGKFDKKKLMHILIVLVVILGLAIVIESL